MMRKLFRFLLVLAGLCMLPLTALAAAADIVPMHETWYTISIPDGVNFTTSITSGQRNYDIRVESSDWTKALMNSIGMSANYVCMDMKFTNDDLPEDAHINFINGNVEDDGNALNYFASCENDGYFGELVRESGVGSDFARYLPNYECIVPLEDWESFCVVYARWYTPEGDILRTGKLEVHFLFDKIGVFHTNAPAKLPKARILPNASGSKLVTVSTADGTVAYKPTGATAEFVNVLTGVVPPAGAVSYYQGTDSEWTRTLNDYAPYGRIAKIWGTLPQNGGSGSEITSITFLDAAGNVLEQTTLELLFEPLPSTQPWPTYNALGWQPVPANRLKLVNNAKDCGYHMSYNNGVVRTTFDGTGKQAAELDLAGAYVIVTPPAGAKSYRWNNNGCDNYLGHPEEWMYEEQDNIIRDSPTEFITGMGHAYGGDVFYSLEMEGGKLLLYLPTQISPSHNYGETQIIYWYDTETPDRDTPPMLMEYYCREDDLNTLETVTQSIASYDRIPTELIDPICVDTLDRGYQLRIRYYFQKGDGRRHFELMLLDKAGKPFKPDRFVSIYLPYPDNVTAATAGMTYDLDHYGLDLYSSFDYAAPTSLTIVPTVKGLRFETPSFSPFVLKWQGEEIDVPPVLPPQTGDSTPLTALLLGMALAVLIMTALGLRRRHRV